MKTMLKSSLTKKNILKLLGLIAFIIIFINLQRQYTNVEPEDIQNFIQQFGIYAPLFFLGISFIRPLVFFPLTVFYLASGLAFGALLGGFLSLGSALIGAFVAHFIANKVGIDFFPMKWKSRICAIQHKIEKKGLRNMIFVRFIPLISFDLISYAAGLAHLKLSSYMLGTMIGIAPRVFAYSYVGANIIDTSDPRFIASMVILLVIFIVPFGIYQYMERKNNNNEDKGEKNKDEKERCRDEA